MSVQSIVPVTEKGSHWIPDCNDQKELFLQKISGSSRQPCSGM